MYCLPSYKRVKNNASFFLQFLHDRYWVPISWPALSISSDKTVVIVVGFQLLTSISREEIAKTYHPSLHKTISLWLIVAYFFASLTREPTDVAAYELFLQHLR